MTSRDRVLRRIRDALGPARGTPVPVPRDYRRHLGAEYARADVIALFTERIAAHGTPVRHVGAGGLPTALAAALWAREAARIAVPAGLPAGWLAELEGVAVVPDGPGVDPAAPDGPDAVVTGCAAAVAETGTIVLDGGRGQGRRALTLCPRLHVCVVHADQIAGTVAEAAARLPPGRPQTWLTGPAVARGPARERSPHGAAALEVLVVEDWL
ncbi:LutC/YkgG family protein [Actinomadura atramentaria]|uniref:LutC/YkgG family protein n=1 Tax=Actinomadura atramentaria TaxID=1990 RepID=UPI0003A629FC|nr:LUD domain-containing protein [Actinomadura atramentaria]